MKNAVLRLLGNAGLLRSTYRAYEALKTVRAPRRSEADGLPVPPPKLIVRVAGTPDAEWFLESGRLAAESIVETLERNGLRIEELDSILDFGCGCGRVIRHWRHLEATTIVGTDYDEQLFDWCWRNLPFARFQTNDLKPPFKVADESFDFAYALSVFTHLPELLQFAWIDELARVLRPAGYLLLTTHGERYLDRLTSKERADFLAGQVVVRWEEVAGTNLCTTFHPEAWVRRKLARGLEVLDFVPEGAKGNPHQDVYLLRKP